MADSSAADVVYMPDWACTDNFDEFAESCCSQSHLRLLDDSEPFSLTQRVGQMGSVTLADIVVGSDLSIGGSEGCGNYRVLVVQSGRTECVYRGESVILGPGSAAIYAPEGLSSTRWDQGSKLICCKIPRSAVDVALSDALGRHVRSSDFVPFLPVTMSSTRSWINMLLLLRDEIVRPNSLLNHPLVGMPFVDSLVRGFLMAAEHPHRDAVAGNERLDAPRAIRAAVEIIEELAHLPLTVPSIARRCHVSTRTLQLGFRRHLATTPMEYVREVRLRRAHESLLEADPSTDSVASIAYRWGFKNLGRFAAVHAERYHEPPSVTLRRSTLPRRNVRFGA